MKVQRVRLLDTNRSSWIVLGDDFLPIKPILVYLKFMEALGRSPNTLRAANHHLKLFWEYLRDEHLDWKNVDIAHLAAFIPWLRNPQPSVISLEVYKAERTDATIDQILTTIHGFYEFHMRMKSVSDLPLYTFVSMPNRRYKPMLYGIARTKPTQTRNVKVKRGKNHIKTLTSKQVQEIFKACTHVRDKFLLALLYETGMRIGHYIGWFVHVNPFTPTFS